MYIRYEIILYIVCSLCILDVPTVYSQVFAALHCRIRAWMMQWDWLWSKTTTSLWWSVTLWRDWCLDSGTKSNLLSVTCRSDSQTTSRWPYCRDTEALSLRNGGTAKQSTISALHLRSSYYTMWILTWLLSIPTSSQSSTLVTHVALGTIFMVISKCTAKMPKWPWSDWVSIQTFIVTRAFTCHPNRLAITLGSTTAGWVMYWRSGCIGSFVKSWSFIMRSTQERETHTFPY